MKYVSSLVGQTPKSAAVKDIDIADIFGHKYR